MRIPDYSYEGGMEMNQGHTRRIVLNLIKHLGITFILLASLLSGLFAQSPNRAKKQAPKGKWLDKSLSPDRRADLLIEQMTLDEKILLVHGDEGPMAKQRSLGGAGFVPGIPRLGVPDLQMTDGRSGVANTGARGRYATALPSALANAASWDRMWRTNLERYSERKRVTWAFRCHWAGPPTSYGSRATAGISNASARTRSWWERCLAGS